MPINNFILATEPLSSEEARGLIRDDVAVADSRFVVNYFRLSADRRLLFGGGENYRAGYPPDLKAFVRQHMLKVFPATWRKSASTMPGAARSASPRRAFRLCGGSPRTFSQPPAIPASA